MDAEPLLFVYGTLMRGFRLHALLEGRADSVGDGEVAGLLFDLGRYPAALRDGGGMIRGEVYRLKDPGFWLALDSVEGSQYHRGEVGVRLAGGRQVTAYIYWYVGPLRRAVPIPGGDYRAHSPAQSIYHR
ncbi:MAG: gamma-glutamylcyclotransferase family protein [Candidatus Rokubacteria bacterium]|nr:gamma-glutamylcyclotransferase family protein [Candidatus Rokubacteria bacterium]